MTAGVLAAATLGWASVSTVVSAVAVTRARRAAAHGSGPALPPAAAQPLPSFSVFRPCTGSDPWLRPALLSTAAICRPGVRVVFAVASTDDPAWPIVQRCAAHLADAGHDVVARVVPTDALNRKVGQLHGLSTESQEPVLVCVDADVDLTTVDMTRLVDQLLASPTTGAVWLPPVEVAAAQSPGDRVSGAVLGASLHAFGLLGQLDPNALVGKVFAVRADALRDAGGFAALQDHLGEDMELARRLRALGLDTQMAAGHAPSIAANRGLRAILARYTRWLLVIRAQRPALLLTYPLLLAAAPLQLIAAAMLCFVAPLAAALIAVLVLAARAAVGVTAASLQGQRRGFTPGRWLLADVALLTVFVRALGPAHVRWGSRTLQLGRGGRLRAAR